MAKERGTDPTGMAHVGAPPILKPLVSFPVIWLWGCTDLSIVNTKCAWSSGAKAGRAPWGREPASPLQQFASAALSERHAGRFTHDPRPHDPISETMVQGC